MLILAIAHTTKRNAYLLALSLPVFSFLSSGHPNPVKMILMSVELIMNVWFYYFLVTKMRNVLVAGFTSILFSKIIYYLLKYSLISMTILNMELISTPLLIQLIMTLLLSVYLVITLRQKSI
jgi:hypothetical protein